MYSSFEDLEVWKRACQLAVLVYQTLQPCKDYSLRDQMQRAAVSVASNIAEGHERGAKEFSHYLKIARGSASELRTQAYIATRVGLLNTQQAQHIVEETKQINAMLFALSRSVHVKPNT